MAKTRRSLAAPAAVDAGTASLVSELRAPISTARTSSSDRFLLGRHQLDPMMSFHVPNRSEDPRRTTCSDSLFRSDVKHSLFFRQQFDRGRNSIVSVGSNTQRVGCEAWITESNQITARRSSQQDDFLPTSDLRENQVAQEFRLALKEYGQNLQSSISFSTATNSIKFHRESLAPRRESTPTVLCNSSSSHSPLLSSLQSSEQKPPPVRRNAPFKWRLPFFFGDDWDSCQIENWIWNAEQVLDTMNIPKEQWVQFASCSLVRRARCWYLEYIERHGVVINWEEFALALVEKFLDNKQLEEDPDFEIEQPKEQQMLEEDEERQQQMNESEGEEEELLSTSIIQSGSGCKLSAALHVQRNVEENLLPTPSVQHNASSLVDASMEYYCDVCLHDCSHKRYNCQKLPDYDVCASCFARGEFCSGLTPSDFLLIEPNVDAELKIKVTPTDLGPVWDVLVGSRGLIAGIATSAKVLVELDWTKVILGICTPVYFALGETLVELQLHDKAQAHFESPTSVKIRATLVTIFDPGGILQLEFSTLFSKMFQIGLYYLLLDNSTVEKTVNKARNLMAKFYIWSCASLCTLLEIKLLVATDDKLNFDAKLAYYIRLGGAIGGMVNCVELAIATRDIEDQDLEDKVSFEGGSIDASINLLVLLMRT